MPSESFGVFSEVFLFNLEGVGVEQIVFFGHFLWKCLWWRSVESDKVIKSWRASKKQAYSRAVLCLSQLLSDFLRQLFISFKIARTH